MSTSIDSYIEERVEILTAATKGQRFRMSNANTPADSLMADAFMRFLSAVFDKALQAREKYGFPELGWAHPDWQADCQRQLAEHVQKGDPRDVAVLAMFCWFHGWSTALPTPELFNEVERILDGLPTEFQGDGQPESHYTYEGVAEAIRKLVQGNINLIDETYRWSEAVKKLEAERNSNSRLLIENLTGQLADSDAALVRIRAAAAPFVKHYASWMDTHPDETESPVFPNHTIGQIRDLRKALAVSPASVTSPQKQSGDARGLNAILDELADAAEWDAEQLDSNVRQLRDFINSPAASPLGVAEPGGWVPVGERLPEEEIDGSWPPYQRVLVARPKEYVKTGYFHNGGWYAEGEDYDGDDLLDNTVTHWQPLPANPA